MRPAYRKIPLLVDGKPLGILYTARSLVTRRPPTITALPWQSFSTRQLAFGKKSLCGEKRFARSAFRTNLNGSHDGARRANDQNEKRAPIVGAKLLSEL